VERKDRQVEKVMERKEEEKRRSSVSYFARLSLFCISRCCCLLPSLVAIFTSKILSGFHPLPFSKDIISGLQLAAINSFFFF